PSDHDDPGRGLLVECRGPEHEVAHDAGGGAPAGGGAVARRFLEEGSRQIREHLQSLTRRQDTVNELRAAKRDGEVERGRLELSREARGNATAPLGVELAAEIEVEKDPLRIADR